MCMQQFQMVVSTIVLNVHLGVDIWDQAGDQANEHIGAHQNSRSDAMMVASSSALLVTMIPCASDVIGLATVTNHLNN